MRDVLVAPSVPPQAQATGLWHTGRPGRYSIGSGTGEVPCEACGIGQVRREEVVRVDLHSFVAFAGGGGGRLLLGLAQHLHIGDREVTQKARSNGLIVDCEALFISCAPITPASFRPPDRQACSSVTLRQGGCSPPSSDAATHSPCPLLLAAPYLLFAVHPPGLVATAAVFIASAGFAATLPLPEQLLGWAPEPVRGQVPGAESACRTTCQGIGATIADGIAQHFASGTASPLWPPSPSPSPSPPGPSWSAPPEPSVSKRSTPRGPHPAGQVGEREGVPAQHVDVMPHER